MKGELPIPELVATWLKQNGYDGLTDEDDCGCTVDDIMPCGSCENLINCAPAFAHKSDCGCDACATIDKDGADDYLMTIKPDGLPK